MPVVVVLSIITVLMNESAIELAARRDMDLDHELRSVGLQNLVGGAGGGLPGFHSVPLTLLAARLKASHAGVGLIVAGLCVAALVFGDVVLAVVPTPLLARAGRVGRPVAGHRLAAPLVARLPVWEYLVVVLIFLAIITVGFVWGLLVGLIAAAVLFVVEYGRVEIVRHVLTGRDYQSGNDSSEERRRALQAAGDAILIVRLQGFLFFGTADRVRRRIQRHIDQPEGAPIRYLVVDFRRVSGLDSSTVMSFTRLAQNTGPDGFTLVFCGMTDAIRSAMARGGFTPDPDSHVRFLGDLDHGLEWCENDLLAAIAPGVVAEAPLPVIDLLVAVMKDRRHAEGLLPYLERIEIGSGETLIEQGAPSSDIFFVDRRGPEHAAQLIRIEPIEQLEEAVHVDLSQPVAERVRVHAADAVEDRWRCHVGDVGRTPTVGEHRAQPCTQVVDIQPEGGGSGDAHDEIIGVHRALVVREAHVGATGGEQHHGRLAEPARPTDDQPPLRR